MSEDGSGSGSSALKIVLIVLAVVFGLGILCCVLFVGAILVPRIQDKQTQTMCANHLRQLGALWISVEFDDPGGIREYDGPAAFLQFRERGSVQPGDEEIFICPGDPGVSLPLTPTQQNAYQDIDLADPAAWLCSYAVRDFSNFPVDDDSPKPEAIAACRYHADGLNVLFDDGSVKFERERDLAIDTDDLDLFGTDTSHPLLRPLRALGD